MAQRKTQTEARIASAFWKLYAEYPIERISIRMLTEEAVVHRSSFYHHYEDIYDLRRKMENQLVEEAAEIVSRAASADLWESVLPMIMRFYRANHPKMTVLLGPTGDPGFLPLLRGTMAPVFLSSMSIPSDDREAYYIVEFLITGVVTFMSCWYLREPEEPSAQTLEAIRTALMEGCCKELARRSDDPARAERFLIGRPES